MHNLSNEYFQNEFETGNNEYANELSSEFEFENGYNAESRYELSPEFEFENQEFEMNEFELSQEFLAISNEFEFGSWLKKIAKKAAGAASGFLASPAGQQAIGALGNIAKKTLPGLASKAGAWAGGKVGGLFGKADYGNQLGQRLGNQGVQAALDRYPDFVKFATDALGNLNQEFETGSLRSVKPAIVAAARKHYPIILKVKGTLYARQVNKEFEYNNEFENNHEFEYNNEMNGETSYETEGEISHNEGTFNEVTEMELASELLSIQSEMELDQFLGKLFKKAVGAATNFARSSTGRALGSMLKGLAKKALPLAGKALGSFIAPGIGTAIGGALGTAASNLFELELEGLSAEDREFETARAFIRFAGNSAKRATSTRAANPSSAARTAIVNSARRYAPGLLARRGYGGNINVVDHRDGSNINVVDHRYQNNDCNAGDIGDATEGTWHKENGRIILTANQE
jgi:uncharacterized protein (DUF697 family)